MKKLLLGISFTLFSSSLLATLPLKFAINCGTPKLTSGVKTYTVRIEVNQVLGRFVLKEYGKKKATGSYREFLPSEKESHFRFPVDLDTGVSLIKVEVKNNRVSDFHARNYYNYKASECNLSKRRTSKK